MTFKEASARPTGIPTTVASDIVLKVPNVADKAIQILSALSNVTMYFLSFLVINFLSRISELK